MPPTSRHDSWVVFVAGVACRREWENVETHQRVIYDSLVVFVAGVVCRKEQESGVAEEKSPPTSRCDSWVVFVACVACTREMESVVVINNN